MQRQGDQELKALKDLLLEMGESVEIAISQAIAGLSFRKPSLLEEVSEIEKKINQAHLDIDEACLKVFARQAPLATDLRMVLAISKINTDLERMGDQAVNISHNAKDYISRAPIKPLIDLPQMGEDVKEMVKKSLEAFVHQDTELAKAVLQMDDSVDKAKNRIFQELIERIKQDASIVEGALDLILIARNLERLGDHATNIAEDVIFAATGKDIRHGAQTL